MDLPFNKTKQIQSCSHMSPHWAIEILSCFKVLFFVHLCLVVLLASPSVQAAIYTVNKATDTADGVCSDTDCSLREAIIAANTNPGNDTIVIPEGVFSLSITGSYEDASLKGDLDITDDVVIVGAGEKSTIIKGNAIDRVFHIASGKSAQIERVTIEGGSATCPQMGGAILNDGTLILESATIRDSRACNGAGLGNSGSAELTYVAISMNTAKAELANTGFGGGIFNGPGAFVRLENSYVTGNSADADGGGIYNFKDTSAAGEVVLEGSYLSGNRAAALGGGVCSLGSLRIIGSSFTGNIANDGGGIVCLGNLCYLTVDGSEFIDNFAEGRDLGGGGAIFSYEGHANVIDSVFSNNKALGEGGGAISNRGELEIQDSVFERNQAIYHTPDYLGQGTSPGFGGALLLIDGSGVFLFNCSITNNEAAVSGGAIYNDIGSDLTVADSLIKDNRITDSSNGLFGGAVLNQGTLTMRRNTIENNIGRLHSGGIENSIGVSYISNSVIKDNSAYSAGGIGNFLGGKVYITGSTLANNIAAAPQDMIAFGGGILNDAGSTVYIVNSTISGNQAGAGGGVSNNNSLQGVVLRNVTIAQNTAGSGSGIYNWAGTIDSGNTILAGNCNMPTGGGQLVSRGGNLEGPGNTCGFNQSSDKVKVSDIGLQSLGENGGLTPTHALVYGSPAIDMASQVIAPEYDQRSASRPIDGNMDGVAIPDAGAFEYGSVAPPSPEVAIPEMINKYYQDILARSADAAGLEWWEKQIGRMRGLGISTAEGFILMAKLFFNSDEYKNRHRTNEDFIRDLYTTFLSREPDAGGWSYYLDRLENGDTRNTVMNNFMFSEEFGQVMAQSFGIEEVRPENDMVNNFYRGLLSRIPDTAGLNYWVNQLRDAQCRGDEQALKDLAEDISTLFLYSDEYQSKHRSNTEYVEDLYDAIMRRAPDPGGMAYWISVLDESSKDRHEVLKFFIKYSTEYQERVAAIASVSCYPGI
jgi:CSLREA domain-containing protein